MLDKLTGKPVHLWVHRITLCGIAAGLPWSKVPVGLGIFFISLNFVLKNDFRTALVHWKSNKSFWWFLGFVAIYLVSLMWSTDWSFGAKMLKTMLGFILIPIAVIGFGKLDKTTFRWILIFFVGSSFIISTINFAYYQHWIGSKEYIDFRGLSLFGSHIRFALLMALAASVSCIASFYNKRLWWLFIPLMSWFLYYTFYSQVIAGYLAVVAVAIVFTLKLWSLIARKWLRFTGYSLVVITILALVSYVVVSVQPIPPKIAPEDWPKFTVNGNPFLNDSRSPEYENGYPIIASVCDEELRPLWNSHSSLDYDTGKVISGMPVRWIILRYMASKGLFKDSLGFTKLSRQDVKNIEKGCPSIRLAQGGIAGRLASIQDQFQYPHDPNGNSLLERLEYWKTSFFILKEKWLFGVGIGDLDREFQEAYSITKSPLKLAFRHRAHNQYLTVWLVGGMLCFLIFVGWWLVQLKGAWKTSNWYWLGFIAISLSSFLTEDTIETQTGAVFIGFFFAVFSALNWKEYRADSSK